MTQEYNAEIEQLKEQLEIVEALSRDYLSVFRIDIASRSCKILKLDKYVTSGDSLIEGEVYPYEAMIKKYIRDRVYPGDQDRLMHEMMLANVLDELGARTEYASGYRQIVGVDIQYYQYKFIQLAGRDRIILGFKNIDTYVRAAKERDTLIEKSELDSMTRLLNRGSGEAKSANAIRGGAHGMLCIFDIDTFKVFNDTYGHNAGDKVIMGVAGCIRSGFRDRDIVFRLGGDEFAVFAFDVPNEEVGTEIVMRIFGSLEQLRIAEVGERKVHVSCGAVIVDGTNNYGFEDLYKQADSAAYISKDKPGNALTFHHVDHLT